MVTAGSTIEIGANVEIVVGSGVNVGLPIPVTVDATVIAEGIPLVSVLIATGFPFLKAQPTTNMITGRIPNAKKNQRVLS